MISNRKLILMLMCLTVLCLALFFIQPESALTESALYHGMWVLFFVLAKIIAGIISCVLLLALFCARPWKALEKTPPSNNAAESQLTKAKSIKFPLPFQKQTGSL